MAKPIHITPSAPRKPRTSARKPTPEQIQLRAYEIYLQRGATPGDPLQDWLQAESELALNPKRSAKALKAARPSKAEAA